MHGVRVESQLLRAKRRDGLPRGSGVDGRTLAIANEARHLVRIIMNDRISRVVQGADARQTSPEAPSFIFRLISLGIGLNRDVTRSRNHNSPREGAACRREGSASRGFEDRVTSIGQCEGRRRSCRIASAGDDERVVRCADERRRARSADSARKSSSRTQRTQSSSRTQRTRRTLSLPCAQRTLSSSRMQRALEPSTRVRFDSAPIGASPRTNEWSAFVLPRASASALVPALDNQ